MKPEECQDCKVPLRYRYDFGGKGLIAYCPNCNRIAWNIPPEKE